MSVLCESEVCECVGVRVKCVSVWVGVKGGVHVLY